VIVFSEKQNITAIIPHSSNFQEKTTKMASQIYKNTTEEWSEKLLQCPYDPVHQIRPERFSLHLIKCRKALENHPTSPYYHKINEYKICRWNNKHHVHKAEIAQHEKECSNNLNALKIRQFEKHEEEIKAQITKNITPINSKLPYGNDDSDSDDWEDDNVAAYDPTQKALQNNILPQGLTPAQRADFRNSRRQGDLPEFMKKEISDPWNQPVSRAVQQQPQRQSPKAVKQSVAGIQNQDIRKNQNGTGNGKSKPPPGFEEQIEKLSLADQDGFVPVKTKGRGRGRGRQS